MIQYPSVTQILKPYSTFEGVPAEVLQAASERGNRVHAACAAHALSFPLPPLENDDLGYLESFKKWFRHVDRVISVETEYWDSFINVVCHPDLVCTLKGAPAALVVVDLKTPALFSKSWQLQLAAYAYITKAQRCFSLRLSKFGKRPIVNENQNWQRDLNVFLNAVSVWRYFND